MNTFSLFVMDTELFEDCSPNHIISVANIISNLIEQLHTVEVQCEN